MDVRSINVEIERLKEIVADKQAALDADLTKHVRAMDFALQSRLQGEIADFHNRIDALREQRHAVTLDPAKGTPTPTAPARSKARKAATAIDCKVLEEYRAREAAVLARFGVSEEAGRKSLTLAEHLISMADLSDVIRSLSERLDAMDTSDAYRGTHQRALSYSKGAMVTSGGGLWIALKDTPQGVTPGANPEFWQLASKGDKPLVRAKTASATVRKGSKITTVLKHDDRGRIVEFVTNEV